MKWRSKFYFLASDSNVQSAASFSIDCFFAWIFLQIFLQSLRIFPHPEIHNAYGNYCQEMNPNREKKYQRYDLRDLNKFEAGQTDNIC